MPVPAAVEPALVAGALSIDPLTPGAAEVEVALALVSACALIAGLAGVTGFAGVAAGEEVVVAVVVVGATGVMA